MTDDSASSNAPACLELIVGAADVGERLDAFLARQLPRYSRVRLRQAITDKYVRVGGKSAKPALRLAAGQVVRIQLPEEQRPGPEPEEIPLTVVFEDEHLAVIDKPPQMVVHPSKGHWSGTLTAALAFHFKHLSTIGGPARPGIVHRLDRDTSGLLVVAKTDQAHLRLAEQFELRSTRKEYLAIVAGEPRLDRDVVRQPIGAHPYQREKMAIRAGHSTSRPAETLYEVLERFHGFALIRAEPKTGRTHQIRLHLAHTGTPVLCDRLYGGRSRITVGDLTRGDDPTVLLDRQALHAAALEIDHPLTGQRRRFESPLPTDLEGVLNFLREHRAPSVAKPGRLMP